MRAIKRTLVICIAAGLLLAGCGTAEQSGNSMVSEGTYTNIEKTTTYRLHIAQPQQVGRDAEFSADPSYLQQKSILTDAEYILKEFDIDRHQDVRKGDVIAVLQGLGSQVDAEQKRLEMNAYAAGAEEMKAVYESALEAAKALPANTENEQAIRSLKIEYAEAELELYSIQSQFTLENMQAELAAMEAAAGEVYIYAPVDGNVRTVSSKFKEGDVVPAGTELCVINVAESQRLYGTSGSGAFVYGREVQVTIGRGEQERSFTGRVVSSPEVQSGEHYSSDIYIQIDELLEWNATDGRVSVSYTVLEDVLAVPSNAVNVQEGIAEVQILDGETVRTRSIVRGPAVGGMVTVLQGLKEGDQIVVSSYTS